MHKGECGYNELTVPIKSLQSHLKVVLRLTRFEIEGM